MLVEYFHNLCNISKFLILILNQLKNLKNILPTTLVKVKILTFL